jgi:hypothetical protein
MIVSYSRNFIFIKTRKTAGSTVEAVLSAGCGADDIISKTNGETYPGTDILIEGRAGVGDGDKPEKGRRKRGEFHSHMTAEQMRDKLDPAFWAKAYKVTVERHPYEKALSQTYFRMSKTDRRHKEEFPEFLDRIVRSGKYAGFPMWSIDGKSVVDEFIHQENLESDLRRVTAKLNIPTPEVLPMLKARERTDPRPAREVLSQEQKDIVYSFCRQEFELLGYER